jgi:hypothetical protein
MSLIMLVVNYTYTVYHLVILVKFKVVYTYELVSNLTEPQLWFTFFEQYFTHVNTCKYTNRIVQQVNAYNKPSWPTNWLQHTFNLPWNLNYHWRIQVRIDPPHPLCVVRGDWMGRSFGWDREKWFRRCGTIKIPPCSKALSAE